MSPDSKSSPIDAIRSANSPTVSVAMCTYNGARFLGEQLQSIQNQSRLPDQLFVCDDGSTDSTQAILKEFARAAPFRVILKFNTQTLGVTRNFEQALSACLGDFIALCDQDDRWHPSKLERLAELLKAHPQAGFACSNAALINHRGERLRGRLWDRWRINPSMLADESPGDRGLHLLRANCVTGATMMVRGALVRTYALPIPPSWVHDHWITVLCEILMCPGCTSAELLTEYRQHDCQVLGLKYGGKLRHASIAEREKLKSACLQRYQDLKFHLECGTVREILSAAVWIDLIHVATKELLEHHRVLSLPRWQRVNRLLSRIRRTA